MYKVSHVSSKDDWYEPNESSNIDHQSSVNHGICEIIKDLESNNDDTSMKSSETVTLPPIYRARSFQVSVQNLVPKSLSKNAEFFALSHTLDGTTRKIQWINPEISTFEFSSPNCPNSCKICLGSDKFFERSNLIFNPCECESAFNLVHYKCMKELIRSKWK